MMNDVFHDAQYIAEDLGIGLDEAEKLIKDLRERLERKGCISIRGKIQISFYQEMKECGFMSDEWSGKERYPLTEKRLLRLDEFCEYAGVGRNTARKLAKALGIDKRIGHKILYDRALFDKWCDENKAVDIQV